MAHDTFKLPTAQFTLDGVSDTNDCRLEAPRSKGWSTVVVVEPVPGLGNLATAVMTIQRHLWPMRVGHAEPHPLLENQWQTKRR